jgi:hypothetical protein
MQKVVESKAGLSKMTGLLLIKQADIFERPAGLKTAGRCIYGNAIGVNVIVGCGTGVGENGMNPL